MFATVLTAITTIWRPGLIIVLYAWFPYKSQGWQALVWEHDFLAIKIWLGLHIVAMITSIDVSQEIVAMNTLKALKSSLKHHRKHVLRLLQLYGDQILIQQQHTHL